MGEVTLIRCASNRVWASTPQSGVQGLGIRAEGGEILPVEAVGFGVRDSFFMLAPNAPMAGFLHHRGGGGAALQGLEVV